MGQAKVDECCLERQESRSRGRTVTTVQGHEAVIVAMGIRGRQASIVQTFCPVPNNLTHKKVGRAKALQGRGNTILCLGWDNIALWLGER